MRPAGARARSCSAGPGIATAPARGPFVSLFSDGPRSTARPLRLGAASDGLTLAASRAGPEYAQKGPVSGGPLSPLAGPRRSNSAPSRGLSARIFEGCSIEPACLAAIGAVDAQVRGNVRRPARALAGPADAGQAKTDQAALTRHRGLPRQPAAGANCKSGSSGHKTPGACHGRCGPQ
jgi:hypothetical protein